ncbi:MAG TPA: hypothetical protein VJ552_02985 [Sediminibacterium sp.]|nr:hypothetical protein [Sediminibacterium sp.]
MGTGFFVSCTCRQYFEGSDGNGFQQQYALEGSACGVAVLSARNLQQLSPFSFVPQPALSYRLNNQAQLYAIAAEGFSSASLAELRPSDGYFYPFLDARQRRQLLALSL